MGYGNTHATFSYYLMTLTIAARTLYVVFYAFGKQPHRSLAFWLGFVANVGMIWQVYGRMFSRD